MTSGGHPLLMGKFLDWGWHQKQKLATASGDVQGSATLSMAYAGALFADACLRGLNGEPDVEEFSYVESQVVPGLPFFSSRVRLGPSGE